MRKSEATLYHLRWTAASIEVTEAEHAKDVSLREVATRTGAQAEASKRQALASAALPELREAEARAGAALHRLNVALQELDREETRAKDRIAELDLRLVQFAADAEREQRLAADAEAALARLAAEEDTIRKEARESAGRRSGVDAKVAKADGELSAAEKIFSDLTTALADLTAQRNQFENAAREQGERAARLAGEMAEIERELGTLKAAEDPLRSRSRSKTFKRATAAAEAAAIAAEAAHTARAPQLEAARFRARRSRKPHAAAGDRGQDPLQDALARDPQPVAAGDRPCLGREGLRRRWAQPSATISTRRSIRRRRCAGPKSNLRRPTRFCPRASSAFALREGARAIGAQACANRRGRARAGSKRLAHHSKPASGWCRAKATCGAGTVLSRRRTRPPAPRGGWRSAADSPRSTANWPVPAPRPTASASVLAAAQAFFEAASSNETGSRTRRQAITARPHVCPRWPRRVCA